MVARDAFFSQQHAAVVVQKTWRRTRVLSIFNFKSLRTVIVTLQARCRTMHAVHLFVLMKRGVMKLQALWRKKLVIRHVKLIVKLQGRRRGKVQKTKWGVQARAVVRMQRIVRTRHDRKDYMQKRNVVVRIAALARTVRATRQFRQRGEAATSIQARWKALKASSLVTALRLSVVRIQAVMRKCLARQELARRIRAAVLVQANWRGAWDCMRLNYLHQQAIVMQSWARELLMYWSIRKLVAEQECAAALLNRVLRGHAVRTVRIQLRMAAQLVQARFRAYKTRGMLRLWSKSALPIQKQMRGSFVRSWAKQWFVEEKARRAVVKQIVTREVSLTTSYAILVQARIETEQVLIQVVAHERRRCKNVATEEWPKVLIYAVDKAEHVISHRNAWIKAKAEAAKRAERHAQGLARLVTIRNTAEDTATKAVLQACEKAYRSLLLRHSSGRAAATAVKAVTHSIASCKAAQQAILASMLRFEAKVMLKFVCRISLKRAIIEIHRRAAVAAAAAVWAASCAQRAADEAEKAVAVAAAAKSSAMAAAAAAAADQIADASHEAAEEANQIRAAAKAAKAVVIALAAADSAETSAAAAMDYVSTIGARAAEAAASAADVAQLFAVQACEYERTASQYAANAVHVAEAMAANTAIQEQERARQVVAAQNAASIIWTTIERAAVALVKNAVAEMAAVAEERATREAAEAAAAEKKLKVLRARKAAKAAKKARAKAEAAEIKAVAAMIAAAESAAAAGNTAAAKHAAAAVEKAARAAAKKEARSQLASKLVAEEESRVHDAARLAEVESAASLLCDTALFDAISNLNDTGVHKLSVHSGAVDVLAAAGTAGMSGSETVVAADGQVEGRLMAAVLKASDTHKSGEPIELVDWIRMAHLIGQSASSRDLLASIELVRATLDIELGEIVLVLRSNSEWTYAKVVRMNDAEIQVSVDSAGSTKIYPSYDWVSEIRKLVVTEEMIAPVGSGEEVGGVEEVNARMQRKKTIIQMPEENGKDEEERPEDQTAAVTQEVKEGDAALGTSTQEEEEAKKQQQEEAKKQQQEEAKKQASSQAEQRAKAHENIQAKKHAATVIQSTARQRTAQHELRRQRTDKAHLRVEARRAEDEEKRPEDQTAAVTQEAKEGDAALGTDEASMQEMKELAKLDARMQVETELAEARSRIEEDLKIAAEARVRAGEAILKAEEEAQRIEERGVATRKRAEEVMAKAEDARQMAEQGVATRKRAEEVMAKAEEDARQMASPRRATAGDDSEKRALVQPLLQKLVPQEPTEKQVAPLNAARSSPLKQPAGDLRGVRQDPGKRLLDLSDVLDAASFDPAAFDVNHWAANAQAAVLVTKSSRLIGAAPDQRKKQVFDFATGSFRNSEEAYVSPTKNGIQLGGEMDFNPGVDVHTVSLVAPVVSATYPTSPPQHHLGDEPSGMSDGLNQRPFGRQQLGQQPQEHQQQTSLDGPQRPNRFLQSSFLSSGQSRDYNSDRSSDDEMYLSSSDLSISAATSSVANLHSVGGKGVASTYDLASSLSEGPSRLVLSSPPKPYSAPYSTRPTGGPLPQSIGFRVQQTPLAQGSMPQRDSRLLTQSGAGAPATQSSASRFSVSKNSSSILSTDPYSTEYTSPSSRLTSGPAAAPMPAQLQSVQRQRHVQFVENSPSPPPVYPAERGYIRSLNDGHASLIAPAPAPAPTATQFSQRHHDALSLRAQAPGPGMPRPLVPAAGLLDMMPMSRAGAPPRNRFFEPLASERRSPAQTDPYDSMLDNLF
jgi:hypothetical protein